MVAIQSVKQASVASPGFIFDEDGRRSSSSSIMSKPES